MTTINSDIANSVQQLYVAYFNRPADVGGLNYWASVVAAQGGSTAAVSASFAKSAEYTTAFAGKVSLQIVDQIYQNLFGRPAEIGGLTYWSLLLDQGKITIDNVVTQVAAGAQGSDLTAYGNKVAAAGLFTTALDSASSALAYIGTAAAQSAKDYISSITTNETFAAQTTPAAITTAVANLVAANASQSNSPQTVQLTAAPDSFIPTSTQKFAGNDTFIALGTVAGGQTFTSFDVIDGGLGTNTFKVISATSADFALPTTASVKNFQNAEITGDAVISGDVSGWTGLTKLTASSVGGVNLTAAATTAVTYAGTGGAAGEKITGGAAVSVNISTGSLGDINISKGTGALTFIHAGGGSGATTLDSTTGNVTSTETGTTAGTLTISKTTGSVTATRTGAGTGTINVTGSTGTVAVSNAHSGAGGDITVSGGTTISVTQTSTNAVNTTVANGAVAVTGGATTTAVTVNNAVAATASATVAGATLNTVTIADANYMKSAAGTITSATVTGFSTLSISDAALTTLSVTGGTGNIIIDNTPTAAVVGPPAFPIQPTATTLGLTINGQTGGTLDDADIYTTLNVTTAGTANSTLANVTFGAATALTVAGTKGLTLTSAAGLTALKTVTVSGSAGITANLSGATVTSVSTAATTGASTVTIDGSKATFAGGAGVDKVTLATGATKTVTLGDGDDSLTVGALVPTAALSGGAGTDTLSIDATAAATASGSPAFAGLVTGFESLILTGSTNQTVDLAVLGNFNKVTTSGGNGLTLSNLPTGGTLVLNGAGTAYTVSNTAFAGGANDILNLILTDGSGAGVAFASTGVTAANVETINVTTTDTQATPSGTFNDSVTLSGNSAKSIVVTGNAGLTLTAASTAATNVDASGITGTTTGGFTWTSGALAADAVVKGSVAGTNSINLAADVAGGVTYTGGTGIDDVTLGASSKAHTINLGGGTTANSVTGGSANGIVTVNSTSTGADSVTLGNGANIVNLGNGANAFTAGSGNNTYTGGTGVDAVSVGAGANTITLGTGLDTVTFTAVPTGVNSYSTITDAHKGVTLTVGDLGTETFGAKITLASTAVFQDYANAVIAQGGNSSANGHFGWFQFTQTVGGVTSTDTYLVESRHDGSGTTPAFVAGQDFIVKLTGVIDLSLATGGTTNIITLG